MNITLREVLVVSGVVFFAGLIYSLSPILMPFLAGFIGAYALSPLVARFERIGIARAPSTILAMIVFFVIFSGILIILVPYMHRELIAIYKSVPLFSQKVLQYITPLLDHVSHEFGTPNVDQIKSQITSHVGEITQFVLSFLINIVSSSMVIANVISILVLTPVVMFFLLKDWQIFLNTTLKLIPERYHSTLLRYVRAIHTTLGGYAKGQAIVCLALIIMYSVILTLIGLPDAFFIGFITGFLAFIPYLGVFTGFLLSMIVVMINFTDFWLLGAVLATYGILIFIEGNFLTPKLIGDKVGLHPVWIIFALLAAANWFGFMGVLVALPVASALSAIVQVWCSDYYQSDFYKQKKLKNAKSAPSAP